MEGRKAVVSHTAQSVTQHFMGLNRKLVALFYFFIFYSKYESVFISHSVWCLISSNKDA